MSRRTVIVVGAVMLVLAAAGVLFALLRSDASVMTNGPGMLYFYSPV